jgi:lipoate-protein ligase A
MIWRFLNSGANAGAFNMEFDQQLATLFQEGSILPTLRVYGWIPSAVSIGYHQSFDDFNFNKLSVDGIDIVKRPTGGRAILHSQELTYSVVMPIENRSLSEIYSFINRGLLEGVRLLGIDAELSHQGKEFRTFYQTAESVSCFSSFAKSEIQYQGRKLVGSAQRRFGNTVLQHGSFLLGPDHLHIVEYFSNTEMQTKERMRNYLSAHSIDAQEILGRPVSFDEAVGAIKRGFERAQGITFIANNEVVEKYSLNIA